MAPAETVLDPGPIPYRDIEFYDDADLEHGLRELGVEPASSTFRLIEIPPAAISETRILP